MLSLGVDYHKKFSQVATVDESGSIILNRRMPNEASVLQRLLNDLDQPCQGVVEASPHLGSDV